MLNVHKFVNLCLVFTLFQLFSNVSQYVENVLNLILAFLTNICKTCVP